MRNDNLFLYFVIHKKRMLNETPFKSSTRNKKENPKPQLLHNIHTHTQTITDTYYFLTRIREFDNRQIINCLSVYWLAWSCDTNAPYFILYYYCNVSNFGVCWNHKTNNTKCLMYRDIRFTRFLWNKIITMKNQTRIRKLLLICSGGKQDSKHEFSFRNFCLIMYQAKLVI